MLRNNHVIAGIVLFVLVMANIVIHICSGWGLVTVKVTGKPIGEVIKSIERQGWVTIYSNIDPQTPVSMYVDHVPVTEALETLAVNSDAQWRLAYFVGPNSAQVRDEIRTFSEGGERSDETKIFSFNTPLALISDESTPVADPRLQTWPGMPAHLIPPRPTAPADGSTGSDTAADPAPESPPSTMQDYLRAFAQQADIWIMAPASWDPPVSAAPAPNPSITSALGHFVSQYHGSVTHAFILRGRPPRVAGEERRPGWGGGGGFRGDFSDMEDRMRNAINGLPPAAQAGARDQLTQEVEFQKQVQMAPPDDRRQMWRQHMMGRMGDNGWRRSPEKRAQMFAKIVSNRMTAQGK